MSHLLKKMTLCLLVWGIVISPVVAEETSGLTAMDAQTKEICNQVILQIYQDILSVKSKHKELINFDERVLYENKYGIYALVYEFGPDAKTEDSRQLPYAFGVTVDKMADTTFPPRPDSFNYSFPLLGLKISGYQKKHLLRTQFDAMPAVKKYGDLLADYQQNFLPLRLELRPVQSVYHVRQDIEFQVILTNVSKRHMIVQTLGSNSLYFHLNDKFWGTSPALGATGGNKVILKSGESLQMIFKGESFERPTDLSIEGVYRMSIKGVNPTAALHIKIVE